MIVSHFVQRPTHTCTKTNSYTRDQLVQKPRSQIVHGFLNKNRFSITATCSSLLYLNGHKFGIGHCKAPLPIFVHCLNNKKFCYSLQNFRRKNLNQYLFFISCHDCNLEYI